MTDNNTPNENDEPPAKTNSGTSGPNTTPSLDDETREALQNIKSETPTLTEFSGPGDDKTIEDAINKWFAADDDVRSETWLSREQAIAISILLDAENLYHTHDHSAKYHVLNNIDTVVDHLMNTQISLDGRGREQQVEVLGGRARERAAEQAEENDDGNEKQTFKRWS